MQTKGEWPPPDYRLLVSAHLCRAKFTFQAVIAVEDKVELPPININSTSALGRRCRSMNGQVRAEANILISAAGYLRHLFNLGRSYAFD